MVLAYYGMTVPHDEMLEVLPVDQLGAVRGPQVGLAALRCGFRVAIIPYEHRVLHPSWSTLPTAALVEQLEQVGGPASTAAIRDGQPLARLYADYVRAGGLLRFAPLSRELLISYLEERTPLIAALDTEYLYATAAPGAPRDAPRQAQFIVVGGYDAGTDEFAVSDPWYDIPLANSGGRYRVRSDRLVTAILLGAEGDHAGLVAIRPR